LLCICLSSPSPSPSRLSLLFSMIPPLPPSTLFPYTTLFRSPFFQYPLTPFTTSEGEIDLPILYYDNSNFLALYEIDLSKANALLTEHSADAVECSSGKTLLAIATYEYRDTAVSAYNEARVALATVPT